MHQAVDNLEEINEPDQVTNACAGHRGRKRRKTCPIKSMGEQSRLSMWPDGTVLSNSTHSN